MDDEFKRRVHLTFEQAEGAASLPRQLQLKELSSELRGKMYALIYRSLEFKYLDTLLQRKPVVTKAWEIILEDFHVEKSHRPIDEFDRSSRGVIDHLKEIIFEGEYIEFFGTLQFFVRHPKCPDHFPRDIARVLESTRASYRLMERTFVPIASPQEGQAIADALVLSGPTPGAREHLKRASAFCTEGKWADSVRESIHAVESVAKRLEPSAKELGPALARIEKSGKLHGAMRSAFASLYGYTSDKEGIRHALLDKSDAEVDEADALFMLGACASFVSFLIRKGQEAGLLQADKP
ncbi:AbiJ-NTD4 domain-containing protein [Aquibium sp. ELW1220]|uniref:AbiJ-NTD4 domain-containing protein n=1 Tax=Aquibium sp. ELW1220 TaxID=2976766 RepID=UPI0025B15132|nr:hypothetical protein [Aquibium sp. ELW1220]MDN2580246.1 hypothetical protein [Aquibium sp. ELW1220]